MLVCGGRDFTDAELVWRLLNEKVGAGDTVVHGAAKGADALAAAWCKTRPDVIEEPHPAQWEKFGKAAGPLRNQEMLDSGIDYALVFPGGRGTQDMFQRLVAAQVKGLRFHHVDTEG